MKNDNLEVWEEVFQQNEWGKYPALGVVKFIARNFYKVENRKTVKVLELGSGTGANLWYIAREGFSVYGVDGSVTAVKNCLKRLDVEGLSEQVGEIRIGDYYDELQHFPDNTFDAIIDVESLYCNSYERSKEILEIAIAKLKDKGVLYSQTFAEGTWGLEGEEVGYHAVLPKSGPMKGLGYSRYSTHEDIEDLYTRANSKITSIERNELHTNGGNCIKEWIVEVIKK
ncbi:MAG: class I SAM-dependent methyltransferase [Flavobacteriales bacterium]|nr:class I SAM-dependent methyltransferase [Flavobacteriales bacterium]